MRVVIDILKKYPAAILAIVSILLYVNTLTHQYVLDNPIVITQNNFVKQGLNGIDDILSTESYTGFFGYDKQLVAGGRYRPLSIVTFALEFEFFGFSPFISHLINILLYTAIVLLIFNLFRRSGRVTTLFAVGVALIYAMHPIHTEVVANIKGRDEILAFLFALLSVRWILFPLRNKHLSYVLASLALFLGVLSKEHVVGFLVLIPLLMYFLRYRRKEILQSIVFLAIPVAAFVFLRFSVLGGMQISESPDLMNNPFIHASWTERMATIFYTWFVYLKLLVVPHPLTYDYYPYHIAITDFNSFIPWLVVFVVCVTIYFAVRSLFKRQMYGYWIWFFAGTFVLMSNLFFSIGTFMNERFMFMSSLSVAVLMVYGIRQLALTSRYRNFAFLLVFLMGTGYSAKTISRNSDWENDFTLFTHDVHISEGSAKGNCVAGGQWYEKALENKDKNERIKLLRKAQTYLRKALSIYPTYNDALLLYGNTQFGLEMPLDSVMPHYLSIFSRSPKHGDAWRNSLLVMQKGNGAARLKWYKALANIDSTTFDIFYNMGVIYGRDMNDLALSEKFLTKALRLKPNDVAALKDLAVVYGMTKRYAESVQTLLKVVSKESDDASSWYNLGVSYHALGQIDSAQTAFDRSHQIDSLRPKIVLRK